jgi:hypothetical protein
MWPEVRRLTRAIAFADNECVEARFPANNPIIGAPEAFVANPMCPHDVESYWNKQAAALFRNRSSQTVADRLVAAVNELYAKWVALFRMRTEQPIDISRPYYLNGHGTLTASSGLLQIKDYIEKKDDIVLRERFETVQRLLKDAKSEFYRLLLAKDGLDYFGERTVAMAAAPPPKSAEMRKVSSRPPSGAKKVSK